MSQLDRLDERVPFVAWAVLWLLAGAIVWPVLAIDIFDPRSGHVVGRDFSNLWVAGQLALSGNSNCIFQPSCFRHQLANYLDFVSNQNYSYPPHALFIAIPFSLLPYSLALAIWTVAGIAFFTFCARPFLPKGFSPLLPALTTAGWLNIWDGHYGFVLGGLWILFFGSIERRPERAGVFAGLLTFKPHLGVMIAVTALSKRAAVIVALATTVALVAVSAIAFGPLSWSDFVLRTTALQSALLTSQGAELYFQMMPSPFVAFGRGSIGILAQAGFTVAVVAMLWHSRRWDAFSASTATFLVLPYCFNYDMTVACLGFAILLWEQWHELRAHHRAALMLAFWSPQLTFVVPALVPFLLLYALAIQLRSIPSGRAFVASRDSPLQAV